MILDTTIHTPTVKRQIEDKIGPSYSFLERLKMGGTGSKRMRIAKTSEHFAPYIAKNQDTIYCSIEKRKNGIAIHFKKYQTVYSWLITKDTSRVLNEDTFTIRVENHFISIIKDRNFKEAKPFLEKHFCEVID